MMNRHWVAVQREESGASKAMPTVAEASEATCTYIHTQPEMSRCTFIGITALGKYMYMYMHLGMVLEER